jgi:DNA-binding response OmpR family regulator
MAKILLVEDTSDLAQVILGELNKAGYQVMVARDGLVGWQLFGQFQPDLVILDWMLPGMDGMEVLRRIRQTAYTPILMLTARSEEADRVIGLEMGADDYLTKPFSIRELLARVHALLRRVEQLQATLAADKNKEDKSLVCGKLRVDPVAYRAELEGEALDLTRTEFDLLYLLLKNPERAFSRSYLLNTVWGEGYIQGDRSVDNTVLRLRKKLGLLGEQIETVWGIGYRFTQPPV